MPPVRDGELIGDPTEGAVVTVATKGGVDVGATRAELPRVGEVPFDSAYKFMATFHEWVDDGRRRGRALLREGRARRGARALCDGGRPRWAARVGGRGDRGRRAGEPAVRRGRDARAGGGRSRRGDRRVRPDGRPVRAGRRARPAWPVRHRRSAPAGGSRRDRRGEGRGGPGADDHRGPRGDGRRPSPPSSGIEGEAVTGAELDRMDDEQLSDRVDDIGVFGRVAPEHKVRLVTHAARPGAGRGHDRRRRQRCAGAEVRRHRHRDGHHRYRGLQAGGPDGADRRQLRHDRGIGRDRAGRSTTT